MARVLCLYLFSVVNIIQIVHATEGHMPAYGPVGYPQNIILTEAKLRSI